METVMKKELKIAIVGSAPSSIRQAPYQDPSWQVWGCSPGAYGVIPHGRSNIWWELHVYEPGQQWFSPEYCNFLRDHPRVVVAEPRKEIPNGDVLPVAEMVAKYSPYFFTSSIAWMMAAAIDLGATKIGLWGVDMAATEEYEAQRAGLHYFAMIARQKGIEVGVPTTSDLFRPRFLYGVDEIKHSHIKLRARREELQSRLRNEEMNLQNATQASFFLKGAIDDLEYMHQTWADGSAWVEPPLIGQTIMGGPEVVPAVMTEHPTSIPPDMKVTGRPRKSKLNGGSNVTAV